VPAGADVAALARSLQQRKVSVSVRGSALRVAPHVYNDQSDVEALLDALREQA
jgi:selenocysteine lyase/cysteine desulfurase